MVPVIRKPLWILFVLSCLSIGLYPGMYFLLDMTKNGLLSTKSPELLSVTYITGFYLHITLGGLALLVGWTQFSKRLREKYLSTHRWVGKIYLFSVGVSGIAGFYIALNATGGPIAIVGFAALAIFWLFTSFKAFLSIRRNRVNLHQQWMIRSYALCFAAVTLRIWLPMFMMMGWPFNDAYVIIAWLCWVPNLIVAELMIKRNAIAMTQAT